MSQKSKRGLQRGLSEIVERQTAPAPDKSKESSSLIAKFRDHPLLPPPTTSSLQPIDEPIAPTRDFARVANSITRDAIPGGLFKGTSKKLYDALYLRTRGAIVPVREIKAKHGDLMHWAGVSHNTLRTHLRHLEAVRLIEIKWELGDNNGAIYEVRMPEELDLLPPPPTTPLQPPPPSNQKLVPPSTQKLVGGRRGQTIENTGTSTFPNTLIKTNTEIDDEAFAGLTNLFRETVKEITGKEASKMEAERWNELAELLMTELKIAAARTTVSNVPAFLTEHLRRRLWKMDKKQMSVEGKARSVEGKAAVSNEQAKDCPDCGGTGFYYPKGFEGGVARCRHERLKEGK
ncbi:MAG: hypothetical protein QOD00_3238 [Blastocatellia bacterium]|jgi:hypothetical protein|nr:hypothetical protein [Blastocatellia bacterium]